MAGAEAAPPYDRTHLSKAYLTGKLPLEALPLRPPDWYRDQRIELELGVTVEAVDLDRRLARFEDGRKLRFERVLFATGAQPRPFGDALVLRSLEDADRLRTVLTRSGSLSILGAGFIGCEVAAACVELGAEVTVYERLATPLQRVLGPEMGAWLLEVHRAHGVRMECGAGSPPDLRGPVLAAIGSAPRDERVVDATGHLAGGVAFAAGDCARFLSPVYGAHVRVEHFQTAQHHGFAAGRAMAGDVEPFGEVPWFWSDQFDLRLQYAGAGLPWSSIAVRGRLGEPPFTVFYLSSEGRLMAAAAVNDARTLSVARRLIEFGVSPPPDVLSDPSAPLKALARRPPL